MRATRARFSAPTVDEGFGRGDVVRPGALTCGRILLQAVAFLVLDLITPGRLGSHLVEREFHPASLVSASVQLAVAAVIVASIWP